MPAMVFLHGWGQSARIWRFQADYFSRLTPVRTPDLPGHGGRDDAPPEAWLDLLARQLPTEPAILVGWSLGGLLTLQLAEAMPERVAGLALVSATPCFCQRPDWPHGCPAPTFRAFEQGVAEQGVANRSQTDSTKLLGRFFALMLQGDALPRRRYNGLAREHVDREQPPTAAGLENGLALLASTDLRPGLSRLRQPAWVAHGDRDAIVPMAAGRYLAEELPHAAWLPFDDCGHAPFLTQAETFNERLEAWCRNISLSNG